MPEKGKQTDSVMSALPTEIAGVISGTGRVTSRMVDDFLTSYSLAPEQLAFMADALYDRVICDGKDKAVRRAVFRMRVKNGLTLKAMALRSPFSGDRLEDIESGQFQSLRESECRYFREIYGIVCIPDAPMMFSEPDDGGVLLALKALDGYNESCALTEFAESVCVRNFDRNSIPGMSGTVVFCKSRDVGFPGKGELMIKVSELQDEDDGDTLVLCCMENKTYRITTLEEASAAEFDEDVLETYVWMIRIDKLIYDGEKLLFRED